MHIKVSFDYLYLSVKEKRKTKKKKKTRKIKIQYKFPHEPNEKESLIYRVDELKASQFHLFSVIFSWFFPNMIKTKKDLEKK